MDHRRQILNAPSFDGVDDYVKVNTISIPGPVTAEAWVYSSNFGANMFVVQKPSQYQWELFLKEGF